MVRGQKAWWRFVKIGVRWKSVKSVDSAEDLTDEVQRQAVCDCDRMVTGRRCKLSDGKVDAQCSRRSFNPSSFKPLSLP
jgi:hypothetical protein